MKASTSNLSWHGWQGGSGACKCACCQPCGLSSVLGSHKAGGENLTPEDCPLTFGEVLHGIHAPPPPPRDPKQINVIYFFLLVFRIVSWISSKEI